MSEQSGWLSRLSAGLRKTSQSLSTGISDVFIKRRLDDEMLEALEELLIASDVGIASATRVIEALRVEKFDKDVDESEIKQFVAEQLATQLEAVAKPFTVDAEHKPYVVLVVGVNGNGKTTTIGKMAENLKKQGKTVLLGAADTFRAAAIEQLAVWATRADVPLVKGPANSDPASVAYQALEQAQAQHADVVMIDTAGRLHTKDTLMAELQKIVKVLKKRDETAPHAVIQVIDGTTGQNALKQIEAFRDIAGVTGLVVTKLDGSTKAGVIVAIAEQFGLPIHAVGVGEGIDDLQPFTPETYARALVGLAI